MARFTEYDDGSRVYPKRGNPPAITPGYEQAPGDPYKLVPIMPECLNRVCGQFTLPCGKIIPIITCKQGFQPSFKECKHCIESDRRKIV
jgi:hypothetical protein